METNVTVVTTKVQQGFARKTNASNSNGIKLAWTVSNVE